MSLVYEGGTLIVNVVELALANFDLVQELKRRR